MNEVILVESKTLRTECLENASLSGFDFNNNADYVSTGIVADFFDIQTSALRMLISRHKAEFEREGLKRFSKDEACDLIEQAQFVTVGIVSNNGISGFTERCVLLVGMLLKGNSKASEMRVAIIEERDRMQGAYKVLYENAMETISSFKSEFKLLLGQVVMLEEHGARLSIKEYCAQNSIEFDLKSLQAHGKMLAKSCKENGIEVAKTNTGCNIINIYPVEVLAKHFQALEYCTGQ